MAQDRDQWRALANTVLICDMYNGKFYKVSTKILSTQKREQTTIR
jgi:hypothetical protein